MGELPTWRPHRDLATLWRRLHYRDKKTGRFIPTSWPENIEMTYSELKRRGVKFSEELTSMSWGKYAILRDLDGNEFEIS